MTKIPKSSAMLVDEPTYDATASEYGSIHELLDAASTPKERSAAIERWDGLRRRLGTWQSLAHLRFHQNTADPEAKRAREYCDELTPRLEDLNVKLKRRLLESPHRPELETAYGEHAFALWRSDVAAFDPVIQDDLVAEAKLDSEYIELLSSAAIEFQGETHNLPGIAKFTQDRDRSVRHDATRARWSWFEKNGAELDRIYDDLVRLRTEMAHKLGYENYIELGYLRMLRIDYDQDDVERFRAQVRNELVPLARERRKKQAERLGVDPLMSWDESVHDDAGNPVPQGDHDWLVERSQEMFERMHPELAAFWSLMQDRELIDLKTRKDKAGGGFCTSLPDFGTPFIFGNFNGTKGDVEVFTHESGHAFQWWKSRDAELLDYTWPTHEGAEVHSMSLEFLTHPHMELFFGADAERFRRIHLEDSLLFLPYGVAVDHFQHLVYERPEATPVERRAMWQEMERVYLPWRRYGDLPHCSAGGLWQGQRHIYSMPFYYIDYTLALTCALQFWIAAKDEPETALQRYLELCGRGGRLPFQALARSAGLVSPFDEGCLSKVIQRARASFED